MKRVAVLFENADCLVLNKPAGLPVQGGAGVGVSLDALLAEEYSPRPLLVHRLDKDTSGLILVARNPEAAARFSALFSGGRLISKHYLAACAGIPEPEAGRIRTDLEIRGKTKTAETEYKVLSCKNGFSLLELELGTGRMHQIRRHLARIDHPILGDDKYGDFNLNKELRKSRGLKRLLLHASRLIIARGLAPYNDPDHQERQTLDITAPLPEYFFPFANCD
jgi:23S rRNA pseudouridine955/2504/2580 synthase